MTKASGWMRIAAAVASGLIVAGAFPPLDLTWLVWVGMMPLLWALWSIEGKRTGLRGFGIGYLAGLAACLIQFNWVASVSWLGALVLPAYLAVYWGLFGFFAAKIGNPWKSGKPAGVLKVAFCHGAVWAGCELLRGWVITGISWNVLGTAFHDVPLMAQAADLFGVVGLSMALVFFQATAVQAIATRKWPALGIATAVMAAIAIYGAVRIRMENGRESIRLKTLLVQLNIPMDAGRMLWTDIETHMGYEDETLKGLEALKSPDGTPSAQWPNWVMWPECALTGRILFTEDGQVGMWPINHDTISQVRTAGPFSLIYGVNEAEAEADGDMLVQKARGRAGYLPQASPRDFRRDHPLRGLHAMAQENLRAAGWC